MKLLSNYLKIKMQKKVRKLVHSLKLQVVASYCQHINQNL